MNIPELDSRRLEVIRTLQHFWIMYGPISLPILFLCLRFCFSLLGRSLPKQPKAPSFQIRSAWNLAGMFLEWMRIDWRSQISDMTSHFQDGGHDVIYRKASSPPRVTSLARCMRYSTWSIAHSYLVDQELISYRYSACSSCWATALQHDSRSLYAPSIQIRSGWNLTGMFFKKLRIHWRGRIFDLTSCFQDGDHDVIYEEKCCHLLSEHEASAACVSSWSIVHLYLFA